MTNFLVLAWFISLITFIVYWRKKVGAKKQYGFESEEYQKISKTKRIIGVACIVLFFAIGFAPNNEQSSSTDSSKTQTEQLASQTKELSQQDKKAISDEVRKILSQIPQKTDEVEHTISYQTWGNDKIPAQTAVWWQVTQEQDGTILPVCINIVHFTKDTNWVFWDTMIFSNGGDKWTKKLDAFAGQSGDGKHTEVVMGGKYEVWGGTLDKVREGMEILAKDGKPILRLKGREHKDDFYLTADDVQRIKTALHLQDLLKKLDYKLVD